MDIQVLVAAAKAALTAGHWERAETLYREAVAAQPRIPEIHFNLANLLASRGRNEEAVQSYQQALRVRRDYLAAHNNLGNLLSKLGQHREAVTYLRRAVELKPDYSRARTNLVIALIQLAEAEPADLPLRVELGTELRLLGRLEEAEAAYRAALARDQQSLSAQRGLAEVLCDRAALASSGDEAANLYREALALRPGFNTASQGLAALVSGPPQVRSNSDSILLRQAMEAQQAGDLSRAEELSRRLLEASPLLSDAWHLLGVILCQTGRHDQGIEYIRESIRLNPDYAASHNNLGTFLKEQGQLEEAVTCFRRALELKPDYAEAHNNLGIALKGQEKLDEAVASYHRALELKPNYAEAYSNLGNALKDQQKLEEAVACHRRAMELKPDYAAAHYNLGNALHQHQEHDEAIACYRRALELKPNYADAYCNLGNTLRGQQKLEEAVACYRKAVELKPDFADAHCNLAHAYLLTGEYERGWAEYEWRLQTGETESQGFEQPQWDGGDLKEKTILIHTEQGYGDSFQFLRYLPLIRDRGGRVIFECPPVLQRIFAELDGVDELAIRGVDFPAFDVHAPLMSLPFLLNSPKPGDSRRPPYLNYKSHLILHWKDRLDQLSGFKVGINWQGNQKYAGDSHRSIRLEEFFPLSQIPGVRLFSLQQGYGSEQLNTWAYRSAITDLGMDADKDAGAFMDTAAIVKNLDLVISVNSALAHLTGALGCPVWLPLSAVPDWRWGLRGENTDWYPSMRLYRQTKMGQWSDVFERMADDLRQLVSQKNVL